MKYMMKQKLALLVGLLIVFSGVFAQEIPNPMQPPRLVNDFTGLLNESQWSRLEKKLRDYHDTTSTQLYVVIVPTIGDYAVGDFTFRLAEKWGVGQKGKNNGAVLLIKPKTDSEKGEAYLAIGYGLEDVIPDALTKRIIEKELLPSFRNGDFYGGIDAATDTMIGLASGKFTAEQYESGSGLPFLFLLIAIIILFTIIGKGASKSKGHSIGHNIPFWVALGMLSGSSRGSGGFGGFSSGSGGFGGFGGGGGGSFGGGGAGGSW
jgi:uncharacterized protein